VPGVEEVREEVDNVEPNHFQGIVEGFLATDSSPTSLFLPGVLLRSTQSIPVDMPPQFVDPSRISLGKGSLIEGQFPYHASSCTDSLPRPFSDNEPKFFGLYDSGYYYPI
jgi:hypothetical protein